MTMKKQLLISTFFILLSVSLFVMSIYIALSAMNHSFDSSVNVGYEVEGRVVLQIVNNEGSNITYDNNKVVYDEDSGLFRIDGVVPEISSLARSSNMQVNNLDELTNSSNQEFYYFSTLKEVGTNSDESILKSQTRYYVSTEEDPIWYTVPETPIAVYSTFLTPNNMTGTQEETEGESVVVISHAVTSLSSSAFMGNSQIESVVIPNSVQSIESEVNTSTGVEEGAFLNCSNLTNVILPSSVENISAEAFSGSGEVSNATYDNANYLGNEVNPYLILTSGLSSEISTINIHSDCEIIQSYAFNNYDNLTSVTLPSKIREIGVYAFSDCNNLGSVVFSGTSLTEIKDNVFSDSGISSIIIPEGVEEIGYESFYACIDLTEITLPSTLKVIDGSFGRCVKLESVTIPSSVTNIGRYAFNGCVKLEEVVLSSGLVVVDDEAFANCRSLIGVILPNTVTTIGTFAFDNCSSMNYVVIPESAVEIDNNAFMSCNNLIIYSETESELASWVDNWNPDSRPVYYFGDWEYDNGIPTHATISLGFVDNIGSDIEETNFEIVYNPSNRNEFRIDGIVPISNGQGGITNLSSLQNNLDQEFYFFSTDETWTLEENSQRYYASTEANPIWYQVPEERDVTLYSVFLTPNCFTGTQEDIGSNTDIVISHQVTTIPYNAFSDMGDNISNITSVIIPNSITRIDSKYDEETGEYGGAFAMCMSLTNAIIPSSIEYVGGITFMMCISLNTNVYENGRYLGNEKNPYLLFLGLNNYEASTVNIHQDCISIQAYAFNKMSFSGGYSDESEIYNYSLKSVNIPSKVKNIGFYAFFTCFNLESITFDPNSELEELEAALFYGGNKIKDFFIPKSVKRINQQAFIYGLFNLNSIVVESGNEYYSSQGNCLVEIATKKLILGTSNSIIPNDGSVTSIGIQAFYYCSELTTITIPGSITNIGMYAFSNCSGLTNVIISEGVTSIGERAFEDCSSLISIKIPSSMKSIDSNAFDGCYHLVEIYNLSNNIDIVIGNSSNGYIGYYAIAVHTSLDIPTGIYNEGEYVMYLYNNIHYLIGYNGNSKELDLPTTSNYNYIINKYAFSSNKEITKVEIPNYVTSIGINAFSGCTNLISVTIPTNLEEIGSSAFSGDYRLIEVYNQSSLDIQKGKTSHGSIGYYAKNIYTSSTGTTNLKPVGQYLMYEDSVNNEYYLLSYLGSEEEITLPTTSYNYGIYDYAFYQNQALTSVTIPNCVTEIGENAFDSCINLSSVNIDVNNNLLKLIDAHAFYQCRNLQQVTLPNGLERIEEYAFTDTQLTSIHFPSSLQYIGVNSFRSIPTLSEITFGKNSQLTTIDSYAFEGASITSIIIPSGITSIDGILRNCRNLISVTLPEGLITIGSSAFSGCISLESIDIPDNVTTIGSSAFKGCTNLKNIDIPNNVTTIESSAFADCTSLENIEIPNGIISIGTSAFSNCTKLVGYEYGNGKYIGNSSNHYLVLVDLIGENINTLTIHSSCKFLAMPTSSWDNDSAFDKLQHIIFDDNSSIEVLSNRLFYEAENLLSIDFGENSSLTTIDDYLFYGCTGLTYIVIPESVTTIDWGAFDDCSNLIIYCEAESKPSGWHGSWNPLNRPVYWGGEWEYVDGVPVPSSISLSFMDNGGSDVNAENFKIVYSQDGTQFRIDGIVPNVSGESITNLASLQNNNLDEFYFFSTDNTWTVQEDTDRFYASSEDSPIWYDIPQEKITLYSIFLTPNCNDGETCSSSNVVISHRVAVLPNNAFMQSTTITSVILPNSIKRIDTLSDMYNMVTNYPFAMCSNLEYVIIPSSIEYIGGEAFMMGTNLTTKSYGNGVYIGNEKTDYLILIAASSTSITTLNVHEDCISIAGMACYFDINSGSNAQLLNLKTVNISSNVKAIGYGAFMASNNITAINIPEDSLLETISSGAFGATAITSITIPSSVTTIGDMAFDGCEELESIHIPANVTKIGYRAFTNCNFNTITVDEENTVYHASGNCLIETSTKTLIAGSVNSEIPSDGSVTIIGENAFFGVKNVTNQVLVLPSTIERIDSFAFQNTGFTSIVVPNSINYIDDGAFLYASVTLYFNVSSSEASSWDSGWNRSVVNSYWAGEWSLVEGVPTPN